MDNLGEEFKKLNKELEKEISNKDDLKIAKNKLLELYKYLSDNDRTLLELAKNQRKMRKDIEELKYTFYNMQKELEDDFEDLDEDEDDDDEALIDYLDKIDEKLNGKIRYSYDDDYPDEDDEEDDIPISDPRRKYEPDYEFEITCPYCDYSFIADESYENKKQVTCPKCKKTIELDWSNTQENDEEDEENNDDDFTYKSEESEEPEALSTNESPAIYSRTNKQHTSKRKPTKAQNKNIANKPKQENPDTKKNIKNDNEENNEDDM